MNTVSTRLATRFDLPRLAELQSERFDLLGQADARFALIHHSATLWTDWLLDERCAIYVAEHDGVLVGYVVGWISLELPGILPPRAGVITELVLDAHSYHGGTGRLLLNTLRDWFQRQGMQQVIACVPRSQAVEQAFWRAVGAAELLDWMWVTR